LILFSGLRRRFTFKKKPQQQRRQGFSRLLGVLGGPQKTKFYYYRKRASALMQDNYAARFE
jgi:hypothetical protein